MALTRVHMLHRLKPITPLHRNGNSIENKKIEEFQK